MRTIDLDDKVIVASLRRIIAVANERGESLAQVIAEYSRITNSK